MYISICGYKYVSICIYICTYTECRYIYIYICEYVYAYIYMGIYLIYVYIYMWVWQSPSLEPPMFLQPAVKEQGVRNGCRVPRLHSPLQKTGDVKMRMGRVLQQWAPGDFL